MTQIPSINAPAPDFCCDALMPDGTFGSVKKADFAGKWVLLMSYPLNFTFVCPTEITQFSDAAPEFEAMDCKIAMWSIDSKFSHLAWTQQPRNRGGLGPMKIPLLGDVSQKMTKDYGVQVQSGGDEGVAYRSVILLDRKGNVRYVQVSDNCVGRNVEEVKRIVQAFQENERTGMVVPCGWKPGGRTMSADPVKSQDYFQAVNQ